MQCGALLLAVRCSYAILQTVLVQFLRFGEHFCFPPIIVGKFEGVREILLDFVGLLGGKKMVWLGIFHLG